MRKRLIVNLHVSNNRRIMEDLKKILNIFNYYATNNAKISILMY